MRVPYINQIVCPFVCLSVRLPTLSLCCDNSNTFLQRTFKLWIWVIYQIRRTPLVFELKGQGHRQFLWVFYIPFSNATLTPILFRKMQVPYSNHIVCPSVCPSVCLSVCLSILSLCCDNWNTFLQRTFKRRQNVCLGKILIKFEYGSSGICLSICLPFCLHFLCAEITGILFCRELSNLVRMFVWARSWSSLNMYHLGSACLSIHLTAVCLSACPSIHTLLLYLCCDNWYTFFYRKLSFLVSMFVWVRSWSSSNMGHLGSICPSTLSLCCDNWNTFLQRTFKLGQNVCLGEILVNFKCCHLGSVSVHPLSLCAAITGILLYRELSNLIRMFVWVISGSSSNMGHLGSYSLSFFVLR